MGENRRHKTVDNDACDLLGCKVVLKYCEWSRLRLYNTDIDRDGDGRPADPLSRALFETRFCSPA